MIRWAMRNLLRASMVGTTRGAHITRYSMYERLGQVLHEVPRQGRLLSISGSVPLCQAVGLGHLEITEGNYPEVDVLKLPYEERAFDFIVSDQVLEHVRGDPQRAIDESRRVLRSGGIAVHTTCLMNPVHGAPNDYWRFTPEALRYLCRDFSRILDCGGWGNPYVWVYNALGLRHVGVPHARWHPIHRLATLNRPDHPIVTWVVAEK